MKSERALNLCLDKMNQKSITNNGSMWQEKKGEGRGEEEESSWSQVTVQTSCQRRLPLDGRISQPASDGVRVLETTLTSKTCKLLVRLYLWRNRQQNPPRAIEKNYWPKGCLPEYNEPGIF